MFKHNIKISMRNFRYHKTSFFINLVGLSTGLASALLIYLWVDDEVNVDKFYSNNERLYQAMEHVDQGTGLITRQSTSGPTAETLVAEMPEVEYAATTTWIRDFTLSWEEKNITAEGFEVSKDYFKVFPIDLIEGNANSVLSDKKSIVISDDLSISLFNTTDDVVGRLVELQHKKTLQVSGVFKALPENSSRQFDFVLSFEEFKDRNSWLSNWGNTGPETFVVIKEGTDIHQFNQKIKDLPKIKSEGEASHRTLFVTRFSDFYLHNKYENGKPNGGRIEYVRLFSGIAIFIVLIACINFMNLSTARAAKRIKEVGVKKTIGAHRGALIGQYLSESLLVTLFSMSIALVLVVILLPQFNDITGKQLSLTFSFQLASLLLGTIIITGIAAGSYPALYLSGFKAATILRSKLNSTVGEQWARKGLVIFQFMLSVVLIVSVLVIYKQIEFVQTANLGYDQQNVLMIRKSGTLNEQSKQSVFLSEIKSLPGVMNASSAMHDLAGHFSGTYGLVWPGKDPKDRTEFERVFVDHEFPETLGMEMKEGRPFSRQFKADTTKIIFNEAAIAYMGIKEPLGKTIQLWGEDKQIIGVVKNFHFQSFHDQIKPLFLYLAPESTDRIMVRIKAGSEKETISQMEKIHEEMNPGFAFNYRFLDDRFQEQYISELRVSTLSQYFAMLAIIISCLGLLGLASFTAERRLKEIGIRKALGANNLNVVSLLTKEFSKMVLLAIVLALPVSFLIAERWLDGFAFRITLEWWFFAGASLLVMAIALATVSMQTLRAAKINPVDCLKED